jgi:hypothetical protein
MNEIPRLLKRDGAFAELDNTNDWLLRAALERLELTALAFTE